MLTKSECLASLTLNGCRKIGRNLWTDGAYNFALQAQDGRYSLHATRIDGVHLTMREALRPLFFAHMEWKRQNK
jgi:hypothetical protein